MKKICFFYIVLFGYLSFGQNHIPNELLIQFTKESSPTLIINQLIAKETNPDFELKLISKPMNIYLVQFNQDENLDFLIEQADYHRNIINIQKNHLIEERATTPNDTIFPNQWYLNNTGQSGGLIDADIDAPEAWDLTTGGTTAHGDTIVVCIIESSGADLDHIDLADNIWRNYQEIPGNGLDDDNNGYIDDFYGWHVGNQDDVISAGDHGTKVAGIIGAVGNNTTGVTGVSQKVKIMIVEGQNANSESSILAAYSYPLQMRKRYNSTNGDSGAFVVVTNSSWGVDKGDPNTSPLWCAMYDSLGLNGIINIASTTNENFNVDIVGDLPTACTSDYLISVTSSTSNDSKSTSGYGTTHIDLASPGNGLQTTKSGNAYGTATGTSFASPVVTGTVALLYSLPCSDFISYAKTHPDSAALKIRFLLLDNVDMVSALNGFVATGGRLNAFNTLNELYSKCDTNTNCIPPYDIKSTFLTDSSIHFNWMNTGSPTSFLTSITDAAGLVQNINSDLINSDSLFNLMPCHNYTIQIQSICGFDTSGYSPPFYFKTEGCCDIPEIMLNSATDSSMIVDWDSVWYASAYILRHREEGLTNWKIDTIYSPNISLTKLKPCQNYELSLKTICGDSTKGFGPITNHSTFGCGICYEGFYCQPSNLKIKTGFEWIESITIGNHTRKTGDNKGYLHGGNFEEGLESGKSYPISFIAGYSDDIFTERFSLWIDINRNGYFEATERLINEISGKSIIQGILYMPTFNTSGITMMRIAMNGENIPSLCGDESGNVFGEYEDYCVAIGDAANTVEQIIKFNIYPNPATNTININASYPITNVKIFDIKGRLILQTNSNYSAINISDFSNGIYIIQTLVNNSLIQEKLIKQ